MHLIGISGSGIKAQQIAMDVTGNNVANVNTVGFKAKRMNFAETLDQQVPALRTVDEEAMYGYGVESTMIGVGVMRNAIGANFNQGSIITTGRPFDLAIEGAGFLQILTPDGGIAYTRDGTFSVDAEGWLTDSHGHYVATDAWIDPDAKNVAVLGNGDIIGDIDGERVLLGRLDLVTFQNAEGLLNIGQNLYAETVNSGVPWVGEPGTVVGEPNQTLGTLRSGALEQSNVSLANEMTTMIQIQRAYQLNARMVSNGDQMWGIANTIRR